MMRLAHPLALGLARAINSATSRARAFTTVRGGIGASWFGARLLRGNEANPPAGRPRRGLTWPLRVLLAASLAVPLMLLGIAAWQNYRLVRLQVEERVMIEAGQLHEQALNTLKTYATVLSWVDARTRGLDWNTIEHDEELHRFLSDLDALPSIYDVWLIDAAGRARVSGRFPSIPSIDVSNHEFFQAEQQQDVGVFVSREELGALTHAPELEICQRRSASDGGFTGIIAIVARTAFFSELYSTISEDKDSAASLVRGDGSILVRYPALPSLPVFSRDNPLMRAIAAMPERGMFWGRGETDGIARFYGYRRIEGHPIYVTYGIPKRDVLAAARANLINYSLFAVPASFALFGMTLLAVRQIQRNKIALWRWQTTARRLKREMNRRALAEAGLHQAQKMEALGQLTGGVAHDFNNLLTVLQGCLEMLSGRQPNESLEARVEMALSTVERGEKLTRQLLAFARRQPLTVVRVNVNELLRHMAELLAQTVGGGVRIETDLAPNLWTVDTDVTQLELAVLNLAINARDAMPEGGVLSIRTLNWTLSRSATAEEPSEGGEFVRLEMSDTGTGMSAEVLARAFEPFFTSKGPGKGTGLGLSMVYGFARQSDGSVSIRSRLGHGTTVTLLLPRGRG